MVEAFNIVVKADSRYPCFSDTFEDTSYQRFEADGIGKQDSAVEVVKVGEVEDIELACIVAWVAY